MDVNCLMTRFDQFVSKKPDRPNIFIEIKKLSIRNHTESLKWLIDHIRTKQELAKKTMVFCREVDTVSDIFTQMRVQLGDDTYVSGTKDSNMATTALGMGLDIPDVDVVVHVGCAKSVLCYWQDVGRCARDGRRGYAIALCDNFTKSRKNTVDDIKDIVNNVTSSCSRERLMQQFEGDTDTKRIISCGQCTVDDICPCTLCNCCTYCRSNCPCQDVINYNVEKVMA
ncbi:LOW QUALITY PROTEIN: probable Werner syndrome ATP-dependent helicase homolog 1 [Haliotis rubra]|uniref:LOW QUALITY PROTEIN: probable Werner syndrome ATP-dependent helicase homolog 1 n=1 Tax=Haliotis rubra TaxID=36100 RepID=UPI001EE58F83|nr:LOW QUALITY PROTEIN: probable Werner syndrome ATP-dependent helicase homolog 1 [Haliotis rubra]